MTTRNKDGSASPGTPGSARPPLSTERALALDQIVGQMIWPELRPGEHFKSAERMEEVRTLVRDRGVGGFCLLGGDVFDTPSLLYTLQQISPIPLLFASEIENGTGQQIRGGTLFPTNLAVGATRSEDLARLKGLITAVEARALGIHLALAPVAEVQTNPDDLAGNTRAFGEDSALVARLAAAFHQGCREKGLLTCARHFPGRGDAPPDDALALPLLRADLERLRAVELAPFAGLVRAGIDAVMTAHVLIEALDRRYPASLSPVVVGGLLRDELGFAGLILTDLASLAALATTFPAEEAIVLAAAAGGDALLGPARPGQALAALEAAARSGRLAEASLRASAQRVLDAKSRLGLRPGGAGRPDLVERLVGTRENLAAAQRIADASITVVKDAAGILPISPRRLGPLFEIRIADETSTGNLEVFGEELRRRFGILSTFRVSPGQDTSAVILRLREIVRVKPKAAVALGIFSRQDADRIPLAADPALVEFTRTVARIIPNTLVVSFGAPHVLRRIPDVPVFICGYSDCETTQRAAARVLCGELPAAGKLPVTLTPDFKVGHGMVVKPQ